MSLRVVAMHEASKKILALVCALLIGELISMVTVLSFSFRTITGLSAFHSYSYGWIFSICSPTAVSSTRLHQDGRPALLLDFLPLSYGSWNRPLRFGAFGRFQTHSRKGIAIRRVSFGRSFSGQHILFHRVGHIPITTWWLLTRLLSIECAFSANAATAFYLTRHGMYNKGVFHVGSSSFSAYFRFEHRFIGSLAANSSRSLHFNHHFGCVQAYPESSTCILPPHSRPFAGIFYPMARTLWRSRSARIGQAVHAELSFTLGIHASAFRGKWEKLL